MNRVKIRKGLQLLILALETATARGSLALASNGQILEVFRGNPSRAHGIRLPGDAQALLARHGFTTADIDYFAVCLGPGSFTGLRVGIATIQGLAIAHGRQVIGISVFDVLADIGTIMAKGGSKPRWIVPWIDGKRGEVFSAIYGLETIGGGPDAQWNIRVGPIAATPDVVLDRWITELADQSSWFIGDAVPLYESMLKNRLGSNSRTILEIPPLAEQIALMASSDSRISQALSPHALRPLYVRRPDAELARDRRLNTRA